MRDGSSNVDSSRVSGETRNLPATRTVIPSAPVGNYFQQQNVLPAVSTTRMDVVPLGLGSSVPPVTADTTPGGAPVVEQQIDESGDQFCERCDSDHHISVCQEMDPWDYVVPFFWEF